MIVGMDTTGLTNHSDTTPERDAVRATIASIAAVAKDLAAATGAPAFPALTAESVRMSGEVMTALVLGAAYDHDGAVRRAVDDEVRRQTAALSRMDAAAFAEAMKAIAGVVTSGAGLIARDPR
jgi:hypothetical protein